MGKGAFAIERLSKKLDMTCICNYTAEVKDEPTQIVPWCAKVEKSSFFNDMRSEMSYVRSLCGNRVLCRDI